MESDGPLIDGNVACTKKGCGPEPGSNKGLKNKKSYPKEARYKRVQATEQSEIEERLAAGSSVPSLPSSPSVPSFPGFPFKFPSFRLPSFNFPSFG